MNKCFFDAMDESMGIGECSGLEITPDDGKITKVMLHYDKVVDAERCLIDNGIDKDEADIVLQALGYILLNAELYPETK